MKAALLALVVALPTLAWAAPEDGEGFGLSTNSLFRGAAEADLVGTSSSHYGLNVGPRVRLALDSLSAWKLNVHHTIVRSNYDFHVQTKVAPLLSLDTGWRYLGPDQHVGPTTAEAHAGLTFAVPGHPFVRASYGYRKPVGWYFETGAVQSLRLSRHWRGTLAAVSGFDPGRGIGGFHDLRLLAHFDWRVSRRFHVLPSVQLAAPSADVARYGVRVVPTLGVNYNY